ncbi:STE20-related kinase adapter protein alpha isoform X1 [Lingula anatina]|uniref:STE20-related kinase adapter protein alpha isoform X1 n=2 Tax=Lingula anatina TaxID=7574 RepID=A0A1S3JXU3_LINAN|nr:STE20-related kinase adapter protein alpha isoform X1 [Lingula anatina]|eukprot:XP_013415127.1 STE20-related kinase adapter protein alpha isoform X1 [Lingula anatina]
MSLMQCYCSSKKSVPEADIEEPLYRKPRSRRESPSWSSSSASDRASTSSASNYNMVDFRPRPEDYQIFTVIGHACNEQATISLAKHIPSGTHITIRRINLEECDIDFGILQHEILASKQFAHSNILPLYSAFIHNKELWAVMPLMGYGSCRDLVCHAQFTEGLPELAIAFILRDVLQALEYIHAKGFIHRGIRASHILVSANGQVRLSGMRYMLDTIVGGAKEHVVHDYPTTAIKSLHWMAPEILEQNMAGYDNKSDIYSIGITACELANGCVPFADMPLTLMLLEKMSGTTPRLLDNTTVPDYIMEENQNMEGGTDSGILRDSEGNSRGDTIKYQRIFSSHFHEFVESCLKRDPTERPTATDLLSHSFFKQVKKKSTEAYLPNLLIPVQPLTDATKLPKDDSAVGSLVDRLKDTDLGEQWSF